MKSVLTIIFSLIMISSTSGQFSNQRLLYIFGDRANPDILKTQTTLLDSVKNEMKERDIKVVLVEDNNPLYQKFKVKEGVFAVVLVGKDGGEKYRTSTILQATDLFSIIDAMPMRRAEMRRKN